MPAGLDDYLQFNTEALKLRSYRQELIAANMANGDTPNYKAVDIDFTQALKAVTERPTRGATGSAATSAPEILYRTPAQASLDGNTVEMDAERAKFADNTVRYEAAMRFLNGQLRTMLAAVQGQ